MTQRMNLIDVGGLGGIQDIWMPYLNDVRPIIFEPNPSAAHAIHNQVKFCNGVVIQKALGSYKATHRLNIAASLGCTSILENNAAFLKPYSVAPAFISSNSIDVECVRYDELFASGQAPTPDIIKIDVQGFELEVLRGFGALLDNCLGIQLEAHFYSVYKNQPLLSDLIEYLSTFGLMLRKIIPVDHFDGDIVEVDAWFTCSLEKSKALELARLNQLHLIEHVWSLPPRRQVFGENQFSTK